ncbi:MAG: hypothetical protein ACQEXQ_16420 [Bacillota bacterium]
MADRYDQRIVKALCSHQVLAGKTNCLGTVRIAYYTVAIDTCNRAVPPIRAAAHTAFRAAYDLHNNAHPLDSGTWEIHTALMVY